MRAIIGGHGAVLETLRRHQPSWDKHFTHIDYVSQRPDPLPFGFHIGGNGHVGQGSIDRLKFAMALASVGEEPVALLDYDVVVLGELPVHPGAIHSCQTFKDLVRGDYLFGHCPYTATPQTWRRVLNWVEFPGQQRPWEAEYGDRLLGLAAFNARVDWWGIEGAVTGSNTIEMADVPRVREAIAKGCPCIHGIKTKEVYEAIFL